MNNIKLLAIDIGGTLLGNNNKISSKNLKKLKKVKKMGIKIALVTARMYSSTKYISQKIDADYGIFGNGSVVMDLKKDKVIENDFINADLVNSLIDFSIKYNIYIHINRLKWEVSNKNEYFALKHNKLNEEYPKNLKSNIKVVKDLKEYCKKYNDIVKVLYVVDNQIDELVENIKLKFPTLEITEINRNLFEEAINKNINYVEISSVYKNKYDGVKKLKDYLKYNLDEILVIGDGINDIEMITNSINSACPFNAIDEVKKQCKYVSKKTNNDSAIEDIINVYIEKRSEKD